MEKLSEQEKDNFVGAVEEFVEAMDEYRWNNKLFLPMFSYFDIALTSVLAGIVLAWIF